MDVSEREYSELERRNDFEYFKRNYEELFHKYGKGFLAIRNGEVLGCYKTAIEALNDLKERYAPGTYSIQECDESESANYARIQRMVITA